jgi:hypothetical protein
MSRVLMPIQYFGLGDIIFEQTVVRNLMQHGDKVLWGVEPIFVDGLNRAYPDFTFIDYQSLRVDLTQRAKHRSSYGFEMLPFQYSVDLCNVPYKFCMASKYMLYNMDYNIWKEKAMWHRDAVREFNLFHSLGLDEDNTEPYNLINDTFRSNLSGRVDIEVDNGFRNIRMSVLPDYSLFDWAMVIQKAATIHTVSTSIIYLLELLELRATEIHLYPRKPEEMNFENIDYILKSHNYILHD